MLTVGRGCEGEEKSSDSPQPYSDVVAYYLQDPCRKCLARARARGIATTAETKTKKTDRNAVSYEMGGEMDVVTFCIFIVGCYCFCRLLFG